MTTETDAIHVAAAREIYGLLDELDRHMNRQDTSGRALLYQVKEHVRLLIVSFDRASME